MAELNNTPILKDYQKYVTQLEIERGFIDQTVLEKCLLMGEEMGELFKAIRKVEKIKIDNKSEVSSVGDELTDIFIYVCAIANRYGLDLETVFRAKEEKNKLRKWE